MKVEPARLNQILDAKGGQFVEVHADVGGVVKALREIDPGFGVRFPLDAREPYWHVYWQSEDKRKQELVMSVQAYQNSSGVWEGLDHRVVRRIMEIGDESYDYVKAIDRSRERADKDKADRTHELVFEHGEELAHAIRKDLGDKHKAFFPKKDD